MQQYLHSDFYLLRQTVFIFSCILRQVNVGLIIYKKNISLSERSVGHVIFVYRLAAFLKITCLFLCPAQKGKYCQATATGKLTGRYIAHGQLFRLSSFPESIWALS